MNKEYDDIFSMLNIYSLAPTNISALQHLIGSINGSSVLSWIIDSRTPEDYEKVVDVIYDKQLVKDQMKKSEIDAKILKESDEVNRVFFLLHGEDEDTIQYINHIAEVKAEIEVCKYSENKEFYEYYLTNYVDKATKSLNHLVFNTMNYNLKRDKLFAKEIVTLADGYIKRNKFVNLYQTHPNILNYPDCLLEFTDEVRNSDDVIEYALKNDHMGLYAESLCQNANKYPGVSAKYKDDIIANIDNYSKRRKTTPEAVKSKLFRA